MLVPTQMKFSVKNSEKYIPVETFDEGKFLMSFNLKYNLICIIEYISTLPSVEVNGYYSILEYAKKLLKTKRPDVGEGITRPKHLLVEFEVCIILILIFFYI